VTATAEPVSQANVVSIESPIEIKTVLPPNYVWTDGGFVPSGTVVLSTGDVIVVPKMIGGSLRWTHGDERLGETEEMEMTEGSDEAKRLGAETVKPTTQEKESGMSEQVEKRAQAAWAKSALPTLDDCVKEARRQLAGLRTVIEEFERDHPQP
jgi:hypothetical protein